MNGKKTRKFLVKTALGVSLAAGVSLYPLMRHIVSSQTADFDQSYAVIEGDTISKQQFYQNVRYGDGKWKLVLQNGKVVDTDQITDFRVKDDKLHRVLQNVKLKHTVDTVRVRYAQNNQNQYSSAIVYGMGTKDSLGYLPSFGMYAYDRLNIRYFKAENEELQRIFDFFNDKYNCTHRHEFQHYLNALAGVGRAGQSYETKFVECCLDEISANIAQLMEQRKHYLENDGDIFYVTSRFKFYADGIRTGKVKPQKEGCSQEEAKLIAEGVFDAWMKNKFDAYVKNNSGRAIKILGKTNYNGIQPDSVRHQELAKNFFMINGVDFYPYIAQRENEIREKIPNDQLKIFRYLKKEKFKQMTYLDQLEQQRIEEGEAAYHMTMVKNKALVRVRGLFNRGGGR